MAAPLRSAKAKLQRERRRDVGAGRLAPVFPVTTVARECPSSCMNLATTSVQDGSPDRHVRGDGGWFLLGLLDLVVLWSAECVERAAAGDSRRSCACPEVAGEALRVPEPSREACAWRTLTGERLKSN